MKKLVFMFVAFAAISFASCGNNTNANTESTDSLVEDSTAAVVSDSDSMSVNAAADSLAGDSVVEAPAA